MFLNLFHATGLFLYSLKTENLWFSDVFRGYRKRPVALNGLKITGHGSIFSITAITYKSELLQGFKGFKRLFDRMIQSAPLGETNVFVFSDCFTDIAFLSREIMQFTFL